MPQESGPLPADYRKLELKERRDLLRSIPGVNLEELDSTGASPKLLEIADLMVESAAGFIPVPLGIVTGLIIDGMRRAIPMALEEPSVVAAATFAGGVIAANGGVSTWATEPVMTVQIFLEGASAGWEEALAQGEGCLRARLEKSLEPVSRYGGGLESITWRRLPRTGLLRVDVSADVRDAMGANVLNTAGEDLRGELEALTGGKVLMAIITNAAFKRRAGARFALPVRRLRRGGYSGGEAARRIELASSVAAEDPERAVTHNKGIMNAISAIAVATGNDWRAIEAGVHAYAARDGTYRALSSFRVEDGSLIGELELPLPFATVGGAVDFHPAYRFSRKLLGNPNAQELARIAAAVGLVQNFAALWALVTEGIQEGHMKLHAARLAHLAGARGAEARKLAHHLWRRRVYTVGEARRLWEELRSSGRLDG